MHAAPFSPLAQQYAPWSLSKAKVAMDCSYRFNLQHVQKVRKGRVPATSSSGRIGKTAHYALEMLLKARKKSPQVETGALLKRAFLEGAVQENLTSPEIEEALSYAHNILRFVERLDRICEKTGVEDTVVEHRFGLRADGTLTTFWGKNNDVFFRGVWDLAMKTPTHMAILDHKSGTPPADAKEAMARHQDQLKLYAVSALSMHPKLSGVKAGLHYLQSEEIVWAPTYTRETIQQELIPWYHEFINNAAACVPQNLARRGYYCAFCEYTTLCPLQGDQA
jgi:hypothetical protein